MSNVGAFICYHGRGGRAKFDESENGFAILAHTFGHHSEFFRIPDNGRAVVRDTGGECGDAIEFVAGLLLFAAQCGADCRLIRLPEDRQSAARMF